MRIGRALERKRDTADNRLAHTRRRMLFGLLIFLLVAATFLVNLVALQVAQRLPLTLDLTANAAFRVGEETQTLLQSLDQDVAIHVLSAEDGFTGSSYLVQAQRILEQYPQLSSRVSLTYVDYVFDPAFASRYPDLTLSQGNVLVTSGDRIRQLQLADLFNYTYSDSGALTVQSSRAEEALTSAILYVTSDVQLRVAVLTGNGMADMAAFTRLLVDNNYDVSQVNLTTDPLDSTYDLALLLGPRIDLSEDALKVLDEFLYNAGAYGKTLLYTADVAQDRLPNMETFLSEWGVTIGDGTVFETAAERTYQYQPYYPVADYVDEELRDTLIDPTAPVLMPLARPLTLLFETRGGNLNEILLQYVETSGVRPADAVESFTVDQAERWGPMPALVLASKRIYGTSGTVQARSNLIVSASTAMLDTFAIQNTSLANGAYVLGLFNALFERTSVVSIQPKSLAGNTLSINTAQAGTVGVMLSVVLPLAILVAGIAVWLLRRYQ